MYTCIHENIYHRKRGDEDTEVREKWENVYWGVREVEIV